MVLPKRINGSCMEAVVAKLFAQGIGTSEMVTVPGVTTHASAESTHTPLEEFRRSHIESAVDASVPGRVAHVVEDHSDGSATESCSTSFVEDQSNRELVCAALIVKEQLKVHFTTLGHLPHLLAFGENLRTDTVLVTCSNGCFLQPAFVRHIFQSAALGASVIPIIAEVGTVLLGSVKECVRVRVRGLSGPRGRLPISHRSILRGASSSVAAPPRGHFSWRS